METTTHKTVDGDWSYEVTHPRGHSASGRNFTTKAAALKAAKLVSFNEDERGDDQTAAAPPRD